MTIKGLSSFAAGLAMMVAPVAASAAPANPASSLSLPTRAGSTGAHRSNLQGSGIIFAVIGIGILAAGLVVAIDNDNNGRPKSP